MLAALLLGGCAGSGDGLDQNGRPLVDEPGDDTPANPADFATIQREILTPRCANSCHYGSTAPQGLRLEEGFAYDMLVNVASVEVPDLLRVEPGNPDFSYLVQKIDGTATAGVRMPADGTVLAPEQIDAIRQWITDGALPPRSTAATSQPDPENSR